MGFESRETEMWILAVVERFLGRNGCGTVFEDGNGNGMVMESLLSLSFLFPLLLLLID